MKALAVLAGVAAVLAGCGGGGGLYPDTDIPEVSGYKLKSTSPLQKSGGVLQSGTLEYEGSGDLQQSYRDYLDQMKSAGWVSRQDEITPEKAVGQLVSRKDNRTCSIEFVKVSGVIRATIKVMPSK
jgi:hypothetical protein